MIPRSHYLEKIQAFIDTDLIKVLTGMRRSGKSVLLSQIQEMLLVKGIKKEQCLYYNFENLNYAHLCSAISLHEHIIEQVKNVQGKVYLFFDEIQEVQNWEKCINSFRVELDCDIYITGSNAKLLSGELATYLAGRYVEFTIYPFSFSEFSLLYKKNNSTISEENLFLEYVQKGGMPYLHHLQFATEPSIQYLKDLYNSVVLKDIIQRNNIRDIDLLERILLYLGAHIGTTFSATSIAKFFKSEGRSVSTETILNYIKASEDAFLLYRAKREDLVGKKILSVQEKYYIADHGLKNAILGLKFSPIPTDVNLIFENIVYLELLRRDYKVNVGKMEEKEIDFVATKNGSKIYVQVAYLLASPECIEREFAPLLAIKDNYPKYVVSYDNFDFSRDGIIHQNIRIFLTQDAW